MSFRTKDAGSKRNESVTKQFRVSKPLFVLSVWIYMEPYKKATKKEIHIDSYSKNKMKYV